MLVRTILAVLSAFILATGCYVEPVEDRPPAAPIEEDGYTLNGPHSQKSGSCRLSKYTGCFEGQIPSAPGIFVEGKSFIDVDEMVTQFADIESVKVLQSQFEDGEDYSVRMVTQLDNRNFASNFEVYLKNQYTTRSTEAYTDKFKLNEIPEGDYKIRIQKPIKLVFEKTITNEDETTEKQTRVFCATLYSETVVEVYAKERISHVFDDFRLYIPEKECGTEFAY